MVGALEPVADRDVARRQVDQTARNEKWADPARTLLFEQKSGLGNAREAADTRSDHGAGTFLLVGGVGLPAGILQRLLGRSHGVDDEIVDLALLFGFHPIVGIELALAERSARNEAADLAGEIVDRELLDAAGAALAGKQPRPARLDAASKWRDEA